MNIPFKNQRLSMVLSLTLELFGHKIISIVLLENVLSDATESGARGANILQNHCFFHLYLGSFLFQ